MTTPARAHDCLINVHFGDQDQPEWMHRVKNEYFKRGDSIFGKWEMEKVLAEMDANGVERAVLTANLREPKSSAIQFVEARPDRFALAVGGLDLLRPMPSLRELESFVRNLPVSSAMVGPCSGAMGCTTPGTPSTTRSTRNAVSSSCRSA
jgi:uncharacterized protein